MTMWTRLRDWWRGWSDDDLTSAREKIDKWKMLAITRLTDREISAICDRGNGDLE